MQNVNDLTFQDESFDYVFTKETLHHLPTPFKGLCEMFRVAKRGVIIIEPNGEYDVEFNYNAFEPTGNYMCTFSAHELIKAGICFGYKLFVATGAIVFYSYFNEENIKNGLIQEERLRLIEYDQAFSSSVLKKPLLILFFLRSKEDYDIFPDSNKFRKVSIKG